jgi:hypothetical protein
MPIDRPRLRTLRQPSIAAVVLASGAIVLAVAGSSSSVVAAPPGVAAVAPIVIYSDIASGPNKGGEKDKGAYLSVFGKHFGNATGLGRATKVFVGDHEVDSYRSLGPSRGRQDIEQITVQIGALGHPKPGAPLSIKVVVDGVASNSDVTFTVNPGDFYFVSPDGDDSNARPNDIDHPYRTVQRSGINNNTPDSTDCPARRGDQAIAEAGVWGLVQPGDFIVMRAGRWQEESRDAFFLRAQNKSGSAPRGTTGSGPITIMGYPGEQVIVERPNRQGDGEPGGGISSADTARQKLGCGAWLAITNLTIETGLNDGPVNTQAGAVNPVGSHWRVVNNELSAAGCRQNSKCRAGGVAGSGLGNRWIGNHVHDIEDRPDCCTSFENHGFYVEGEGSYEIAYNRIENVGGGNGVQTYASIGPAYSISGVSIHHNLIRNVGKHGINIADGSSTGIEIFSNLIVGADQAGLRLNSSSLRGARVFHNTFVGADRIGHGAPRAALMNDGPLGPGSIEFRNNIVVPGGKARAFLGGSVGFADAAPSLNSNLWFNGRGSVPPGSRALGDPLFMSLDEGFEDFRLRPGSPALRAGTPWPASPISATDFDLRALPRAGQPADLGAFQQPR